jgi:hypothetical protein
MHFRMNTNLKFGAAIAASLITGFFIGRENPAASHPQLSLSSPKVSNFENDALGFLNWFRLSGRDEITKNELVRNLRILESKAIASGKLIAFRGTPSDGTVPGILNGDSPTD